jgi:3-dehydroquinate synthase
MVTTDDNSMRINLKREIDDSYDIVFSANSFLNIALDLKKSKESRYAIITDSNVQSLYGFSLENALNSEGLYCSIFSFKAGEQSKTESTCMNIIGEMSRLKYDRDSTILALGGGVVGDMAGWIAANYLRGIPYIQIPTTVLAQADSSIGGKTAVDTEYGKNLIGSFYQPKKVYIDVKTLETLTEKDFKNGLVETIKHGIIQDADFFDYLEQNVDSLLKRDLEALEHIAKQNCRIKGNVVEKDPNEKGLRRILNYSHTIGHAIEKLSDYELTHGEAVSIGMMVEANISNKLGYLSENEIREQQDLLTRIGAQTDVPRYIPAMEIIEVATRDKKAKNKCARYSLPKKIGEMNEFNGEYATPVDNNIVLESIYATRD